jgi:general secretion pathway protein I
MKRQAFLNAGFTLIEVLVALGMVSIALVAGASVGMALTRHAERQPEVLLAQLCAHNTLTRLRLARQLPAVGESLQACAQAGHDFEVRLNVQETANTDFRQIRVQVQTAVAALSDASNRQDAPVLLSLSTVMGRY